MKIELNTSICPIIIPDTYGTDFCYEIDDEMWDDFKQLMVDKAKEAIEYALDDLGIPYEPLEMGGFHSPREYNFYTDWIDFTINVPDDYVKTVKENVKQDEISFFRFAKQKFGSYDGFISFYPYHRDDFYESEKNEYIISMWIMYQMDRENDIEYYQQKYLYDVWEYVYANGYNAYCEYEED